MPSTSPGFWKPLADWDIQAGEMEVL